MTTDSRRYALIDTDPGIDDALALLLAWSSPEWTVEIITVVAGNVSMKAGTLNVFRLLELRRPSPAPLVASGAAAPLARPLRIAPYHGTDGLGDLLDWPPVELHVGSADAPGVIVDAARRRGRSLTIVALGPMTNLALAVERDAAAVRGVGRVVAMGGAVDVPGNVTPDAEFNAHVDPDALARVLDAGVRLDLVPLDATRQAVLERAALHATLARTPGPLADGIRRFTEYALRLDEKHGRRGMDLHDPLGGGVGGAGSGREVRAALAEEGIGVAGIASTAQTPTGTALILVDRAGRNQIGVAPGANRALTVAHVHARGEDFAWAEVVVASCEIPLECVAAALELARRHGATTILNPAPVPRAPIERLDLVDYLTPNAGEAARLSGAAGEEAAADALVARGAGTVIVTLGAD